MSRQAVENRAQLQPDEPEQQRVEQEAEDLPEALSLDLLVRPEMAQRPSLRRSHCQNDGPCRAASSRRACCRTQARWRVLRVPYFGFQYTGTPLE
jgi:hypothetical protein